MNADTKEKGARVYTIHSLDEIDVDTRVQRIATLTQDEARALTIQIQRTSTRLWLLVTEAHDRKAHLALGYDTWADYARSELKMSESRSYQFLDTGHVMKALASAGVDLDSVNPPPVRVVNRVKDRLTEVRKAAGDAVRRGESVDKAIRTLAREPRKGSDVAAHVVADGSDNGGAVTVEVPKGRRGRAAGQVPCPVCAGTGKVTQQVADKMLELIQKYVK